MAELRLLRGPIERPWRVCERLEVGGFLSAAFAQADRLRLGPRSFASLDPGQRSERCIALSIIEGELQPQSSLPDLIETGKPG